MKKLDKLEKYVIAPNVNFYGGFVFDGEDIFLCDDHDEEEGYSFHVRQEIINSVLITELQRDYKRPNGLSVQERSYMEIEIEKGQLLVYVQGTGFTISEYNMCKIDDAVDIYNLLKGEA